MHVKKFLPKLIAQAEQSDINSRHAAAIVINGKPVAWAMNELKGLNSFRAEVAVIYKYLIMKGEYELAKSQYHLWRGRSIRQCQKSASIENPVKCDFSGNPSCI